MCGIVGFFGDSDAAKFKAFEQLLYINALRGMDSTGVLTVNTQNQVKTARAVGEPTNLLVSREFKSATEFSGLIKVAVGHNRFGTGGGISKETAHPFEFDNIVGVHNGVIGAKYRFDKHTAFKVDSEAMYSHMNTHGVDATINLLGAVTNSYSLVFWDKAANTLNFLRNSERPMCFAVCDDNKTVFFASEGWMLTGVLGRNNIKHGEIVSTEAHLLYTFANITQTAVSKPLVRSVEPPKFSTQVIHTLGMSGTRTTKDNAAASTPDSKKGGTSSKKDVIVRGLESDQHIIDCKVITEFTIEGAFVDLNGGSYVRCTATNNSVDGRKTYAPFRLYYRKEDEWVSEAIGEKIFSKVSSFTRNIDEGVYYKVSPWDVVSEVDQSTIVEEEEPLVAVGEGGQVIEIAKWRRKYQSCCWCSTTQLDPDDCQFVKGEVLCGPCSRDDRVISQMNEYC